MANEHARFIQSERDRYQAGRSRPGVNVVIGDDMPNWDEHFNGQVRNVPRADGPSLSETIAATSALRGTTFGTPK